jgi:hypothetical protein
MVFLLSDRALARHDVLVAVQDVVRVEAGFQRLQALERHQLVRKLARVKWPFQ